VNSDDWYYGISGVPFGLLLTSLLAFMFSVGCTVCIWVGFCAKIRFHVFSASLCASGISLGLGFVFACVYCSPNFANDCFSYFIANALAGDGKSLSTSPWMLFTYSDVTIPEYLIRFYTTDMAAGIAAVFVIWTVFEIVSLFCLFVGGQTMKKLNRPVRADQFSYAPPPQVYLPPGYAPQPGYAQPPPGYRGYPQPQAGYGPPAPGSGAPPPAPDGRPGAAAPAESGLRPAAAVRQKGSGSDSSMSSELN
jgi:hypothetical protein